MLKNLKVLLVEDMENDAVLIVRELRKQGYDPMHERVDTAEAMQAALENNNWDIILSDHSMPSFSSGAALEIRKQKAPHLPVILVSGTIGEEATVKAVKAGIADFVNKANLDRLVPVMERVLRETENRNRREHAEMSLMRLDAAISTIDETIIITDTQGIIQYVNPAFERTTGYSSDETLGANIHMLESGKHDQEFYQYMQQAVARGDIWKGLVVNKKKDGSLYDVEATLSCTRLPDGTVSNYITVQRDVTLELKLEQQYRQAQKMEAIGALAGGIAHDFNNILAAIMGYTQIAIDTVKDRPATSKHLQAILKATDRAGSLVKQILTFSRKTDQETKPVMPKTIIKEALKLLRASLPSTIEMREVIRSDSVVLADPTHIHQVIMNLCTNAGYAMREKGGTLEINLDDVNLDTASAEQNPGLSPGQHVKLCVTDTGNGISPEVIERIFDPFFTTKPHGEGTGLGLSVIHGIIKSCEGAISVQSEIGKGTVFQIYLPIIQAEVPIATQKPEAIPRGTENILFVDDEPMLVDISKKILESLGYRVAVCTASNEALAVFKKDPMAFDAVLTDYTMPKMTGLELAQEIMNIRPDIPIILCTGNTETITQQKGKDIGICECILKPLKIHDLATTLRKIFDKQPA
jgi:PAS domain S-box-containing protein